MKLSKQKLRQNEQKRLHRERRWSGKGIHYLRRCEFEIVYKLSSQFPIEKICKLMEVNRSSFYKWRYRQMNPSQKHKERMKNIELFLDYHRRYPTHGYRWLNAKIRLDLGLIFSDNYAHTICKYVGIRSVSKIFRKYKTTDKWKIYPNLLLADLSITKPLKVIVSDMTTITIDDTYYEITLYMDLFNNEIVAYDISTKRGDRETYFNGLEELIKKKEACKDLESNLHTDQGSVYASKSFNNLAQLNNITHSMSRVGTPTDNGAMEAING